MKVLVIRFSSIGDIVLTTPVVRCIKQQHPDYQVHYLTKITFAPLLTYNPYIDKLHYLHDNLNEVIQELKKEKFDVVIDLHNNLRTIRVKLALGAKSYAFNKLNKEKWLLTNFKINILPDESIVERYLETVRPLNVRNDGKGLDYFLPPDKKITNDDLPMSHWGGYVGFVIGGSCFTRRLPAEQWKKLCALVPYPIVLMGGPEELNAGIEISATDNIKIYNSCGKFNINESAELVKYARVIVTNDTGLMHISAAFKKPIISIWGNNSPDMGMFPYYGNNNLKERIAPQLMIMETKGLRCHPCSKIGYGKCPKGHFKCMNDLDMNKIAEQLIRYWRNETAI